MSCKKPASLVVSTGTQPAHRTLPHASVFQHPRPTAHTSQIKLPQPRPAHLAEPEAGQGIKYPTMPAVLACDTCILDGRSSRQRCMRALLPDASQPSQQHARATETGVTSLLRENRHHRGVNTATCSSKEEGNTQGASHSNTTATLESAVHQGMLKHLHRNPHSRAMHLHCCLSAICGGSSMFRPTTLRAQGALREHSLIERHSISQATPPTRLHLHSCTTGQTGMSRVHCSTCCTAAFTGKPSVAGVRHRSGVANAG